MYVLSPEVGLLIALIIAAWLIGNGVKSAAKMLPSPDPEFDDKYKSLMKKLGPMTWQEHVVGALLIVAFVALVVWIACIL